MARVFTVYNCGTGFNRERTDEVIANLASQTEGAENCDWMITDGVGSKPSSNPLAKTPGLDNPVQTYDGWKKTDPPPLAQLKGITEGYGWEDNVDHAVEVIQAIAIGSNPDWTVAITVPYAINMAGWSRGAITCHMLAHALVQHPYLKNIPVNIFAFDPVPGPDNFHLDQVSLPSNVNAYTAVIAEDESRSIMKPVVFNAGADDNSGMKFKTIPLPGAHNTAVLTTRSEVGTIGAALAHKFLTKHGTRLRDPLLLTDVQFCELYAKVRMDIAKYRQMQGSGLQRKLLGTQARNVPNNLRDTAYFINDHHCRKFAKAFPTLWQIMNTGAGSAAEVDRTAKLVRGMAPTTYQSLVEVGIL
jgi:hypothetical protein